MEQIRPGLDTREPPNLGTTFATAVCEAIGDLRLHPGEYNALIDRAIDAKLTPLNRDQIKKAFRNRQMDLKDFFLCVRILLQTQVK